MPTLLYDGDCGFCTSCVRFIERRLATDARLLAWQETDLAAWGITQEQAEHSVQWIATDGRVSAGAAGVARLLIHSGWPWKPLGWLMLLPPCSWLAALVYRVVSDNRHRLPGGTPACALPADQRPQGR